MGKPAPSFKNNLIGICIAKTACKATDKKLDLVARSGQFSIFQAVKEIYHPCTRDEIASRDGVTEVQLNKALQRAGFKRVRDRRAHAIKRKEDPTGAGMYLFSNLRWRDPENQDDRLELISGWNAIIERIPQIAGQCTLGRFLSVIHRFHQGWLPNSERMIIHSGFEVEVDEESDDNNPPVLTPLQDSVTLPAPSTPTLGQEILRLQLELAKAQLLTLLQNQSLKPESTSPLLPSLPSTSSPSARFLPAPPLLQPTLSPTNKPVNVVNPLALQIPLASAGAANNFASLLQACFVSPAGLQDPRQKGMDGLRPNFSTDLTALTCK